MKKYKLIKEYPGSPNLGTELIMKGINSYHSQDGKKIFNGLQPENYPEFWEEIVEKDYEILSFKSDNGLITKWPNGLYGIYSGKFTLENQISKLNQAAWYNKRIHSIKRLSDGEIFTVGDKIENSNYPDNFRGIIEEFRLKDGEVMVYYLGNDWLKHIQKVKKQPLFTTEDGVDIFEGDICYYVRPEMKYVEKIGVPFVSVDEFRKGYKYFSTKEAAEEHVLLNKPCLSINDVMSVSYNPVETRTSSSRKLKELVKSKL